jgi:hypothetical protein
VKNKQFEHVANEVSGFKIDGDVKDMKLITTAKKDKLILVAINNDYMRVFKCR